MVMKRFLSLSGVALTGTLLFAACGGQPAPTAAVIVTPTVAPTTVPVTVGTVVPTSTTGPAPVTTAATTTTVAPTTQPAPTTTTTVPPAPTADDLFLMAVHANPALRVYTDETMRAVAVSTCSALDAGVSWPTVAATALGVNPTVQFAKDVGFVMGTGVAAFCPSHSTEVRAAA